MMPRSFELGRNKKKLIALTALCLVAFVASAATQVTNELMAQPEHQQRALANMRNWCNTIVLEMSAARRHEWQDTANSHPLTMVRACTVGQHPQDNPRLD
ncbi:MAG: hypothetical protein K9N51_05915 [Candidatus Pacebacteria bacterium]|nr:hypothetical protein [Candidatus Paceibacterota bacterium]